MKQVMQKVAITAAQAFAGAVLISANIWYLALTRRQYLNWRAAA